MYFPTIITVDDSQNEAHLAVLKELENIDDECDTNNINFVKISNLDEAKEYGLDTLPALVYFENKIPSIYEGNVVNKTKSTSTKNNQSMSFTSKGI